MSSTISTTTGVTTPKRFLIRLALRRVRQARQHLVGLLVLLTLAVFEPLFCIIHCEIWMPLIQQHQMQTHQHGHMHSHGATQTIDSIPIAHPAPMQLLCGIHGPLNNPAHESPAQPFHEMMLAAALLLLPLQVRKAPAVAAARSPLQHFPDPLQRPPISRALRLG